MKVNVIGTLSADDITLTASSLTRLTNGSLPTIGTINLSYHVEPVLGKIELGSTKRHEAAINNSARKCPTAPNGCY